MNRTIAEQHAMHDASHGAQQPQQAQQPAANKEKKKTRGKGKPKKAGA